MVPPLLSLKKLLLPLLLLLQLQQLLLWRLEGRKKQQEWQPVSRPTSITSEQYCML
jgi:hypothetical protein